MVVDKTFRTANELSAMGHFPAPAPKNQCNDSCLRGTAISPNTVPGHPLKRANFFYFLPLSPLSLIALHYCGWTEFVHRPLRTTHLVDHWNHLMVVLCGLTWWVVGCNQPIAYACQINHSLVFFVFVFCFLHFNVTCFGSSKSSCLEKFFSFLWSWWFAFLPLYVLWFFEVVDVLLEEVFFVFLCIMIFCFS